MLAVAARRSYDHGCAWVAVHASGCLVMTRVPRRMRYTSAGHGQGVRCIYNSIIIIITIIIIIIIIIIITITKCPLVCSHGDMFAGPDWKSFVATQGLVLVPILLFFICVAPDVGAHVSWTAVAIAGSLAVVTISALLTTGLKDPGIVPRCEPASMPDMCALASFIAVMQSMTSCPMQFFWMS
jgi:hypothetical protein